MEMQYFYICDLLKNKEVQMTFHTGKKIQATTNKNIMTQNITNMLGPSTYTKKLTKSASMVYESQCSESVC